MHVVSLSRDVIRHVANEAMRNLKCFARVGLCSEPDASAHPARAVAESFSLGGRVSQEPQGSAPSFCALRQLADLRFQRCDFRVVSVWLKPVKLHFRVLIQAIVVEWPRPALSRYAAAWILFRSAPFHVFI